jgi:hypothetical protein
MLKKCSRKKLRQDMTWESSVTRKIILKWVMKKASEVMWTGLMWLRIRSSGGLLE